MGSRKIWIPVILVVLLLGGIGVWWYVAIPHTPEQSAASLHAIAAHLLEEVAGWPEDVRGNLAPLVGTLGRAGWRWAPLLKLHVG